MKATAKQIFSEIQGLNPTTSEISSIGSFISQSNQMITDAIHTEVIDNISKDSLAYKIMFNNTSGRYSDKQLWVIAFELEKNEIWAEKTGNNIAARERKANAKKEASKAKLSANKEGSQDVLSFVKSEGRKLGDYYAFVKNNKKFSREFYSKKFTMESANAFLNS